MPVIIAYIAYFVFSTIAPIQRRLVIARTSSEPKDQVRLAFEVMLILAFGSIFFQFFTPLYFSEDKILLLVLTLVCGLFGMAQFALNYMAQKHVDASITNVVVNVYTPVTIFLSYVFLEEGLTPTQVLGTVLLLAAMVIISKKHRVTRFTFDRHFTMMLASGVLLAVLLVAERALQKETGLAAATMLSWGSQCFFLGLAARFLKSGHAYTNKEIFSTGGLMLLAATAYVTLVYLVGNLSLVSSVTTFKIVTIFVAAAIFLKEREDLGRKILGSIIALIGLLLM